ncbi:hypothetical protein [Bradyrhizobium sp. SZCCHNR2032]|uniref:hypothetical protein n=1 Tax=Bradyrhizobium sp. SZCCHNR2032 TaxID=3057384 RepID=UPI002916A48F|nr:hypothetical protein [Bradyrhizobium sp. SZCCHNR2032]
MSDLIAALDRALAGYGEDFILRRAVGTGTNIANVDVTCRGRIDAVTTEEIASGIKATDLKIIFSPTQIDQKGWPGGTVEKVPPFNIDQRIPRVNGPDKVIVRGQLRQVAFCNPVVVNGELVRIELRVAG